MIAAGVIAAILIGSKVAVDRSLVRIRHRDDPGSFAGLFAPNERKSEYQFEMPSEASDDQPR